MTYFFVHYKENNQRETYRHFKYMVDVFFFCRKHLNGTKGTITLRRGYKKQEVVHLLSFEEGQSVSLCDMVIPEGWR
jgi:hypothetical protein